MKYNKGQSTIEFTFAVMVILLIAYGLIMVFRWVGLSYAERRYKQEHSMTAGAHEEQQVANTNNAGYRTRHLQAVYPGSLYAK